MVVGVPGGDHGWRGDLGALGDHCVLVIARGPSEPGRLLDSWRRENGLRSLGDGCACVQVQTQGRRSRTALQLI